VNEKNGAMTFIAEFLPLIANGGIRGHAPGFHEDKHEDK